MFLLGGAIGGVNTLAVIEARDRVGEHQASSAITLFSTLGRVLARLGTTVSYVSEHRLIGVLFIAVLILRRAPVQE